MNLEASLRFSTIGADPAGEPDILADPIAGKGLAMFVCTGSMVVGRLKENMASVVPGALAVVNEGLSRRAGCLLHLVEKEWRLIPVGTLVGESSAQEVVRVL